MGIIDGEGWGVEGWGRNIMNFTTGLGFCTCTSTLSQRKKGMNGMEWKLVP